VLTSPGKPRRDDALTGDRSIGLAGALVLAVVVTFVVVLVLVVVFVV
jgi:uncharacterized membrane protein